MGLDKFNEEKIKGKDLPGMVRTIEKNYVLREMRIKNVGNDDGEFLYDIYINKENKK